MRWFLLAVGLGLAASASMAQERVFGPELPPLAPFYRPVAPEIRVPGPTDVRPLARDNTIPRARWENRRSGDLWTRVTLASVEAHGRPLIEMVPEDIGEWCPAYPGQTEENRAAFWTALISTLSRYESTWNEQAVGGGGLWHGLMQILPSTAELRGCRALTGQALRDGTENVSCAVRIMAITVPRDGSISLKSPKRWQGVAADWGPIRTDWMRRDMQRYTRKQTYCRPLADVRPRRRPEG